MESVTLNMLTSIELEIDSEFYFYFKIFWKKEY